MSPDIDGGAAAADLAERVRTSRLLGADKSLVLHGGGNTSVKSVRQDCFGESEDILYVKGSGWDLETIEPGGFPPVRLGPLRRLATLPALSDPAMVNELVTNTVQAGAPVPSVEAILHAILPYKFVDHTHADDFIAVCNAVDGEARVREIYGDSVVVVPYVMPGFDLARLCAQEFQRQAGPGTIGMVLLHHGVFSFGDSAEQSYARMLDLVGRASDYLRRHAAWEIGEQAGAVAPLRAPLDLAGLRARISAAAGGPMLLCRQIDPRAQAFAGRADLAAIALQGPATPDHVIRTKRLPMLGRDVDAYVADYRAYFERHAPRAAQRKTMLDPAPRVVLDSEFGLCTVGRSAADAGIVADIYRHTIDVMLRAQALGGWRALAAQDIFDVEYWDLEQAKLARAGRNAVFAGEVALVTGAASGIGRACAEALLRRGAAVVALDLNPAVCDTIVHPGYRGLVCDLADEAAFGAVLAQAVGCFGGIDMLVLNAGIFPGGSRIADLQSGTWRDVMAINLDANLMLLRELHPYLKLASRGGRVVVIGSKNVPAPGPGAAAYSASKAALNQLARVAALEWGSDRIRINTLHPNAVFDTGLWTDEVLAARAAHYGLGVDAYKRNNVLGVEVLSRDVAELAAEMLGPLFAKTTGAQLPVDGGNERVI